MISTGRPFIAWHPLYNFPLPAGHRFPMIKYQSLHDTLLSEEIVSPEDFFKPEPVAGTDVLRVHDERYVERLFNLQMSKQEERRIGFPLSRLLMERERVIAGGTIQAAWVALETGIGMNVAGGTHHAGHDWGEGFCMLNDQAIAARYLITRKAIKQALIIDLDVHQGNGSADIFLRDDQVFTFSIHGEKNFPFKKETSDLDIGLEDGATGEKYLRVLDKTLENLIPAVKPDFVFFQSGVDVLVTDRMGRLSLTSEECERRDQMVFRYCKQYDLPVEVSMGGGYSKNIADIVTAHCNTYREALKVIKENAS